MNDIKTVVTAQEYIKAHHTDIEFSVENVCSAVDILDVNSTDYFKNI